MAKVNKIDFNGTILDIAGPLYDEPGNNTDGAMTQKATTDALDEKQDTLTEAQLDAVNSGINSDSVSKLNGIATGAQVNTIETVKVNGTALTPDEKVVNISVPTKTSDLTNDSGYQTEGQVNDAISAAVSAVYKYKGSVNTQSALPTSGNTIGDVYNVLDTDDNYAWTGTGWDKLAGSVDLTNYYTKGQTDELLGAKADTSNTYTKSEVNSALANKQASLDENQLAAVNSGITTAGVTKLNGIAAGAQVNTIETVKVNGTALTPTSKAVNVSVPTKTSDLTNDSNYVTTSEVNGMFSYNATTETLTITALS